MKSKPEDSGGREIRLYRVRYDEDPQGGFCGFVKFYKRTVGLAFWVMGIDHPWVTGRMAESLGGLQRAFRDWLGISTYRGFWRYGVTYTKAIQEIQQVQQALGSRSLRGTCYTSCRQLMEMHPELVLVRGHYLDPDWGSQEHWWCQTPEGEIVDPTKEQFPSMGMGVYKPWDESQDEPTGLCPDCGGYCYEGSDFCSEECERAYTSYVMSCI